MFRLFALLLAIAIPQLGHSQSEPLRIGFLTVRTGPLAAGGKQMEQGIELFLKERNSTLAARIRSYELAARMQASVPEAVSFNDETEATKRLYGLDDKASEAFGRNCLLARRLLERGVRFVQVWSGADNGFPRRNWDSHENILKDHGDMGTSMDRPAAALIKDLKARGMLDDTLVIWGGEFGRTPMSQGGDGRDHHIKAFSFMLAGGGIKPGYSYGTSDDLGYAAEENPMSVHDFHATMLHLLGVDHKRLAVKFQGLDVRLTGISGDVVKDILA